MISMWLLVLLVAGLVARKQRSNERGRGWRWSVAWIVAGFLWSISLVTGLSIGVALFPLAAAALLWTAWRSPHLLEGLGFAAGIGVTVAVVAAL